VNVARRTNEPGNLTKCYLLCAPSRFEQQKGAGYLSIVVNSGRVDKAVFRKKLSCKQLLEFFRCGGDKSTQARDIVLAKKLAQEWEE
jgi:hypothetical protein